MFAKLADLHRSERAMAAFFLNAWDPGLPADSAAALAFAIGRSYEAPDAA